MQAEIASRNCKQKLQAKIASKNCKQKLHCCCRPLQFIQIYCLVIPRNQFTIPPNNRIAVLRWFAIWALASMDKSNFSKNLCTKKISAPKSICTKKSLHQKSLHQKISSPKTISAPKKSRHQIYCTPIWTGSPWHVEASISKLKKRHLFSFSKLNSIHLFTQ